MGIGGFNHVPVNDAELHIIVRVARCWCKKNKLTKIIQNLKKELHFVKSKMVYNLKNWHNQDQNSWTTFFKLYAST